MVAQGRSADMLPASQQRRISPRALTGGILAILGTVFVVVGALIGAYMLLARLGVLPGQGTALVLVTTLLAAIFGGIGLLELLAGLVLWLIPGDSPPANVIAQYYAAIANQDYRTAFQYLDPYMRTPQGQPFTPDWFIQAAQAADSAQGRVTDYALSGVKANPGYRIYTIKVTRGSGPYRTRLNVQKQGFDWKIMSFDRF